MLFNIFKKKKEVPAVEPKMNREKERIAARKGELGEYKIDIQLGQLPKDCRYLSPESVMKSFLNSPPKPDIIMLSTSLS